MHVAGIGKPRQVHFYFAIRSYLLSKQKIQLKIVTRSKEKIEMFLWWLFFLFRGRISRLEYLISGGTYTFIYIVASQIGNPFALITCLFPLISGLAVSVKRSHDRGRSGVWEVYG
ncbi:MAG: DUF805 domain-containing protein [Rhodomicrobium sp.]|nr:DUF805 domain-containing protein [Rhodomicrobium sp.]